MPVLAVNASRCDPVVVDLRGPVKLEKSSFRGSEVLRNLATIQIKDDKPHI